MKTRAKQAQAFNTRAVRTTIQQLCRKFVGTVFDVLKMTCGKPQYKKRYRRPIR